MPRYPEQLLLTDHSGRMPRLHEADAGDPLFIDFTEKLERHEAENLDELVRRYNLHGKLVDVLKDARAGVMMGIPGEIERADYDMSDFDENFAVIEVIDAILKEAEVIE